MASTSTSSVRKSFKYDVFLSFRGDDTRNNFVSHLYKALEQRGIRTYKDDKKIGKGETIDTQLMKSIEDSRFYIIVFSKNYASSSWCLNELVKIIECQKASEQTAYPVFYDVKPTHIRNQSGPVEEAFKKAFGKHENKEVAGRWSKALNEAGNLAGWESKKTANGDESKLIQIIVDDIFKKICSSNSGVDRNLVGMETRIEAFLSSLELDAHDARMIGIWGMGGGGKTTLARAVFDRISYQFEGKAFVENVREVSKSSLYGLNKLQEQILCSVLTDRNIPVRSVHEGTNMMKTLLRGIKVLIVLDDVDDREQLEALAGEPNWFEFGSRVIITTRDKQVLLAHPVNFINNVNLLSHAEGICLLSKHAFKIDIPIEGYEELSKQVVEYADGLPLTIKVLGSLLCSQNKRQWMNTLERLKRIPLKATMEKLEISYIDLEEDYKEIFLDVACLLKGWNITDALIALQGSGFFAESGLNVLEQRSLIYISEHKELQMHDHIEEMGKNIVRRMNPDKPERHSRLWIQEEIEEILANDSGTKATKCISLVDTYGSNFGILMKGLANMKELRFLHVSSKSVSADEVSNWNLPNALRFLRWRGYPFSGLPKTFQATNLVGLVMFCSKMVKLWKDGEETPFPNLRLLMLYNSPVLRTIDLSVAPKLETLILGYSDNLIEVRFQVTTNLKDLRIYQCTRLEKLHMPAETPKLTSLDFWGLKKLRILHLGITPNLETLTLRDCADMVELVMPAECPKLVHIDIGKLKLTTLHLGITPNLTILRLRDCADMVELRMPAECPKLVYLNIRRLKLTTLHLGITQNLETLRLRDCADMVELRMPAECPKLVYLDIGRLKLTTLHLGITPNLENLRVSDCADMVELRMPAECPKLANLHLHNNAKLRALDVGLTSNLEMVGVENCTELVELYIPVECPKLVTLCLDNLKLRTLHFGMIPNIKWLRVKDCRDLVELWTLHIPAECPKLEVLDLRNCNQLVELPEEIGQLECLEVLIINGTGISRLPESIFRLKGLSIIGSRWLLESYGFTPEIKIFDGETFYYIEINP